MSKARFEVPCTSEGLFCISRFPVFSVKTGIQLFDNIERDYNEVKKLEIKVCNIYNSSFFELRIRDCNFKGKTSKNLRRKCRKDSLRKYEKEKKSERRMPWLPEARKDVVSCEKLRGSANRN